MKRYLCTLLGTLGLLAFTGIAINWIVDPLWFSYHENRFNRFQYGIDDRQQKTNRIAWGGRYYDAVLLGSSRAMGMDAAKFESMELFNYSAAAMQYGEYLDYLEFFSRVNGEPKTIVIGLDFKDTGLVFPQPSENQYLLNASDPFYRWKMLLSLDALKYAIKGSIYSLKNAEFRGDKSMYTRQGARMHERFSAQEFRVRYEDDIRSFRKLMQDYQYRGDMLEALRRIRHRFPDSRLILFTTPITRGLFEFYQEQGLEADYRRWVSELAETFGVVHNFMGDNFVTRDAGNFADAHHTYPHLLDEVAQCLSTAICKESVAVTSARTKVR